MTNLPTIRGTVQCCTLKAKSTQIDSNRGMEQDRNVTEASLSGRRILVVDDEPLVSMLIEDLLLDFGCESVLMAAQLSEANAQLKAGHIDAALLDINLAGEKIYPFAEELQKRKIPFIFSTGYDSSEIIPKFQQYPILQKPFQPDTLMNALVELLSPKRHK